MFKTLLLKQFREMFSGFIRRNKKGKKISPLATFVYIALVLYAVGFFSFVFFKLGEFICPPLVLIGYDWLYISLLGLVALTVSVITSVFSAYTAIYKSKDNELLLSLPVKPFTVLMSRLTALYMYSLAFTALVMVPGLVSYYICVPVTAVSLFSAVVVLLFTSLFCVTLSCFLAFAIGAVTKLTGGKGKNVVTVILSLAFMVLYYYLYSKAMTYLNLIVTNASVIAGVLKTYLYPLYALGKAVTGDLLSLGAFILIISALFALLYFILSKTFLKFTFVKQPAAKTATDLSKLKCRPPFFALVAKEAKRFVSSSAYMLNCGLGVIFTVAASVFIIVKSKDISVLQSVLPFSKELFALIVCAVVSFMSCTNDISAPSVSLEGKNLWILKTLPVDPVKIIYSKVVFHLTVCALPTAFLSVTLCTVLGLGFVLTALTLVFNLVFLLFCALLGITLGLKMPNFDWQNETVAVKQSGAVVVTLFGGWGICFLLIGLYFLVKNTVSPLLYFAFALAAVSAASVFMLCRLKAKGAKMFGDL